MLGQIRADLEKLSEIVARELGRTRRSAAGISAGSGMTRAQHRQAQLAQLAQTYIPPGELRPEGPRNDNDFAAISAIRIAPTQQELLCDSVYLPVFIPDAPHHLAVSSMERHLDIQFRLLREELM